MLFDSTVRRELARSFGATLVVILTIVITIMLIRTLGQAASGQIAPEDVVLLLGYFALQHVANMMSLSLFVAVVVTLGRMYRDSEMAIWFSSGIGLARFVRPVFRMAWPVLLVIMALLLIVMPWSNRSIAELRQRFEQRSDMSRVSPGVFQTSRDGSRVFFVDRASQESVDAHNVFILAQHQGVESVTSARSGRVEFKGSDQTLVLENGQRAETDSANGRRSLASFKDYRVLVNDRDARGVQTRMPKALYTPDLLRDPSAANQGELAWRLGMVLVAANLMVLGVGLAATNPRKAGNWNLLFALLGFIIYFNLVNLSQVWVASGRYGLGSVLLGLHGGALAMGLALLWWRDHGTVMHWLPRRQAT
jgi:lipopolysaccharide export system permease protein